MKKYALKYCLFLLPFAAAVALELFVLPSDFFTFRAWETLVVKHPFGGLLKGPFYPNMTLVKTETGGDLKPSSACAEKKKDVLWQTDAYGYRKAPSPVRRYPVIVVGDSNAAGGGLSQEEMFSEVLEKRLGLSVYPLAPDSIKYIFKHGLLKETKPDVIILENIERGILTGNFTIRPGASFQEMSRAERLLWKIRLHPVVQRAAVTLDRALKANMLQFLRARINARPAAAAAHSSGNGCPILFLQGEKANRDVPDETRRAAVRKIRELSIFFTGQGIRFIFLPIPNKENIYSRELGTPRPVFLEKLIAELREAGVEVIDTQKAYEDITRRQGRHLYHRDDTHWNAAGVETAAALVSAALRQKPPAAAAAPR